MRRRKNKKQVRIIIILSVCLLFIMTAGYAAFQTNLSITAKGNIHKLTTVNDLKNNIVTTGDGLYLDTYEEGRYIYKGSEPNNYIKFSNDLYRIVSIEKDEVLKLIKNDYISATAFDTSENRYSSGGYCSGTFQDNYCGCNAWSNNKFSIDSLGNSITSLPTNFINNNKLDLSDKEASINIYLNTNFYNSLGEEKKYIINYKWHTGQITRKSEVPQHTTLADTIDQEKAVQWIGKIGLISVSDYVRGSLNDSCEIQDNFETGCLSSGIKCSCSVNNYLYKSDNVLRTISPITWTSIGKNSTDRCVIATVMPSRNGAIVTITATGESNGYATYYPSFYISASKFLGSGTKTDPYVIKS